MTNYYLATGKTDEERLRVLNKILNPITSSFLLESGLQPGMQVLEIGCGYGQTAIWLAKTVGPKGKVYAIDLNEDTLKIARENAQKEQIQNIEFIQLDINNLATLNKKFDFSYGRWVIEFCKSPFNIIENIYNNLNNGAIFTYETSNFVENENTTFLSEPAVNKWHNVAIALAAKNGAELNMAKKMYPYLKTLDLKDISARRHQPILTTAEQKSIYRLGMLSCKESLIQNAVLSEKELDNFIDQLYAMEKNDDMMTGFFSNLLIKGIK